MIKNYKQKALKEKNIVTEKLAFLKKIWGFCNNISNKCYWPIKFGYIITFYFLFLILPITFRKIKNIILWKCIVMHKVPPQKSKDSLLIGYFLKVRKCYVLWNFPFDMGSNLCQRPHSSIHRSFHIKSPEILYNYIFVNLKSITT